MGLTRPADLASVVQGVTQIADAIERTPAWRFGADMVFQNTYVDVGAGNNRARFWKEADGVVYMAGQVQRPAGPIVLGEVIFPLPAGYRARNSINFIVSASTVPVAIAELQIDTAVRMISCQGAAPFIVWLTGIVYPAEL